MAYNLKREFSRPEGSVTIEFEFKVSDNSREFYGITATGTVSVAGVVGSAVFSKEDLVQVMSQPRNSGEDPTLDSTESIMTDILEDPRARYSSFFVRQWLEGAFGNPMFNVRQNADLTGTVATLKFPKTKEFTNLSSEDVYSRGTLGGQSNQTTGDYVLAALIATDGPLERDFLKIKGVANTAAKAVFVKLPQAYLPWIFLEDDLAAFEREQLEAERDLFNTEQNVEDPIVLADIEAQEITEAQKESNLTINEQAILLFRVGDLMEQHKARRASISDDFYKRFVCLDYKNASASSNVSNHITSVTGLSPIFDNLRPVHVSAMIPKIRLFKQYLPEDKKDRRDSSAPRHLVEFEFEEFADSDILRSSLSTNTGVGINSFEWHFDGENQFTAERFVKANLKLTAQSIDAIDRKLVNSVSGDEYSFTDLVLPPSVKKETEKKENINQTAMSSRRDYEARVIVEYGILDRNSDIWGNDLTLVKAIESLRLDMNLTLATHSLDLQSDGTVLIDLNFIGRVDASSSDPYYANILPTRAELEQLNGVTAQRKSLLEERQFGLDKASEAEAELNELASLEEKINKGDQLTSDEQIRLEEIQKNLETVPAAALKKEAQFLNLVYKKDLSEEDYLEAISSEFDKTLLYQRIVNGLVEKSRINVLRINPDDIANDDPLDVTQTCQSILDQSAGEVFDGNAVTRSVNDDRVDQLSGILRRSVKPLFSGNDYYIKYFHFGDLVEVVLEGIVGDKDRSNDIRTLLGPIEIEKNKLSSFDFSSRLAFQSNGGIVINDLNGIRDLELERVFRKAKKKDNENKVRQALGVTGQDAKPAVPTEKIVVNLADVPISLNLFLSWFAENVANNGVYSYSFQKFMVDSIQSLIVSALQADSTKLILPKQKRKVITTPFETHAPIDGQDVFGFTYTSDDGLVAIPQPGGLFFVEDKLIGSSGQQATLPVFLPTIRQRNPRLYMPDYLLVYAESVDYTRTYNGSSREYRRDLEEGIYHLHAGRDAGVVKEVKLSAVNFEYYEEMRMLEAKKNGEPNKKRVYSATVTMNGLPIFRPGQKVYLNPTAYGTLSILKEYGLVGYYSVVRTSSIISQGQYQTTLECAFLGSG